MGGSVARSETQLLAGAVLTKRVYQYSGEEGEEVEKGDEGWYVRCLSPCHTVSAGIQTERKD